MKSAITSTGSSLESKLDQRFGRCSYFAVYDDQTEETEFIINPNKEAHEGAGPASVQLVASKKVGQVISGEFGIKIKSLLETLNIRMIVLKEPEKTIGEVVEMLKNKNK